MANAQQPPPLRTNWAGNLSYSAPRLFEPRSVQEVQSAVRVCHHLHALGSRHSFNAIADDSENQISLSALNSIDLDPSASTVTVGAGVRYGDLAPVIEARGFALKNLASLPHISVAGAIATATHGSGLHNGNLATAVSAVEFVDADGRLVQLSRSQAPDQLAAAAVHLGALGILTRISLEVQPTFQVAQTVYLDLPFAELEDHLEEIFASGYSVSLFTDWQNSRFTQVWIKRRTDCIDEPATLGPEFFAARRATEKMHPIPGQSAEACTDQFGIPGPWYDRLPHFRMKFIPSSGDELQSEYFVPLEHACPAIRVVETLRDRITPHLLVSELRTVEADNLWMSMAYQRRSLAIHFTWKPAGDAVLGFLLEIEACLAPFHARPHWGKIFTLPPAELRALYPRFTDFRSLVSRCDASGKFCNQFLTALCSG